MVATSKEITPEHIRVRIVLSDADIDTVEGIFALDPSLSGFVDAPLGRTTASTNEEHATTLIDDAALRMRIVLGGVAQNSLFSASLHRVPVPAELTRRARYMLGQMPTEEGIAPRLLEATELDIEPCMTDRMLVDMAKNVRTSFVMGWTGLKAAVQARSHRTPVRHLRSA